MRMERDDDFRAFFQCYSEFYLLLLRRGLKTKTSLGFRTLKRLDLRRTFLRIPLFPDTFERDSRRTEFYYLDYDEKYLSVVAFWILQIFLEEKPDFVDYCLYILSNGRF